MSLKLLLLVYLGFIFNAFAQKKDNSIAAALPAGPVVLWQFSDLQSLGNQQITLSYVGEKTIFSEISDSPAASLKRGGDGRSVAFNGKGWLSGDAKSGNVISGENFTLALRVKLSKSGGLIKTNLCSIILHPSGLLLARLPVSDSAGTLSREFPLSFLEFDKWYDLVLRVDHGKLNFIADGIVQFQDQFSEKLKVIDEDPLLIGAWRIEEPPGAALPQAAKDWLYERPFKGEIDHVAIWNRVLTDEEIAKLCDVKVITKPSKETEVQKTLRAYSDFHNASRSKNVREAEKLGQVMRKFMVTDPKHPLYHLSAPMDGLFDPAGAFYHKGQYHVFSYRNIVGILANSPLAHYVSNDLIHWKDQPIAIWADSDLDEKGIWLGNVFYDDTKTPTMIYTALGKKGKIAVMAKSHDDLLSFSEKKPVMTNLVHHDGHTWKEGNTWYSITVKQYWGKLNGKTGDGIMLLSSPDLINWTELGEIFNVPAHPKPADANQKDGLAEFPYLLPFGDKHVLMVGTRPVRYWIGKYDKNIPAFIPDEPQGKLLDFLNYFNCFNPSAVDFKGPEGAERRIIMAMNINMIGNTAGIPWYGVHVLPRILTREGDRLVQEPVPEAKMLRSKHYQTAPIRIHDGKSEPIKNVKGDALEIIAEFQPGSAKLFGLILRSGSGKKEDTRITYDVAKDEVRVEGGIKITSPYPEIGHSIAHYTPGQKVKFHLFLDRALLEVFVNGEAGSAVFEGATLDLQYYVFSEGGDAKLISLEAWDMKPAWEQ
ncbi:GH32 C-terminal domain-containing protein [Dyadobacter arcticus]|uniref:beta-fructofuranosidase n=1 Tax=Dyadobacter arcticus TaxID=1078754 RepID=A0ABX0UPV0_9BACT|nr:GH32 C-terminal domain-containing protein [Dyadobacter arcticus]NIJ55028.1 sucrose-6-phosphate hydrolase SacC (GH32 family) [Dyadobacter arcticus]